MNNKRKARAIAAILVGMIAILLSACSSSTLSKEIALLEAGRASLLKDYAGTDTQKRIEALRILRHDRSLWPELIRGLEENGNEQLALAFVEFGNEHATADKIDAYVLRDAAVRWAEAHGYKVYDRVHGLDPIVYYLDPDDDSLPNIYREDTP